jgi:hypothetical protein
MKELNPYFSARQANPGLNEHSDFLAVAAAAVPVVGTIFSGITSLGSSLGIGNQDNHDHQTNMTNQWNTGDHNGAIAYMISWFDGSGKAHWDHVKAMLQIRKDILDNNNVARIPEYNAYVKSWLDGVGSPVPVELLSQTVQSMSKRPEILAWLNSLGGKKLTTSDVPLYCALDYLQAASDTSTQSPSQNTTTIGANKATSTATGIFKSLLSGNATTTVYDANGNPIVQKNYSGIIIIVIAVIVIAVVLGFFLRRR